MILKLPDDSIKTKNIDTSVQLYNPFRLRGFLRAFLKISEPHFQKIFKNL